MHLLLPARCEQPRRVHTHAARHNGGAAAPASDAAAHAAQSSRSGSSAGSAAARQAAGVSTNEDVDVRQILSDPDIEGDPLQFLKVTEAYWKVQFLLIMFQFFRPRRRPAAPAADQFDARGGACHQRCSWRFASAVA